MKYLPDILSGIGFISLFAGLYMAKPWIAFATCGTLLLVAGLRMGK